MGIIPMAEAFVRMSKILYLKQLDSHLAYSRYSESKSYYPTALPAATPPPLLTEH